ncbi:unnamed protein product [Phytophthora lilii]|uniref:Unnamed protein product n=1 Tax=Phytophthora lilii TaxID=2077276 RepID=A0A9W6U556_9STRA|nr:unnamed protein product [Phytophthora lilii]
MERQVWFQLRDGEGNPIGSASRVKVPSDEADVVDLQDAVKLKCSNTLAQVDAPFLTVFENEAAYAAKQAMKLDAKTWLLGGSLQEAVVVQVPERDTRVGVGRNLNRVQVPFATRELNHLLDKDTAKYIMLGSSALTHEEALLIRAFARSAIKSATQRAIAIREGVLLDGPLNLSQGQANLVSTMPIPDLVALWPRKYMMRSTSTHFREVEVDLALGRHDNIVQFFKSFSIENADNELRHIIVMPFFARCAADLLAQQSSVELRALVTIAPDCISALCLIHSKNTVRLGTSITEITEPFCLDAPILQGSELLDWTCLGTTLAQLAGIDISMYYSRLSASAAGRLRIILWMGKQNGTTSHFRKWPSQHTINIPHKPSANSSSEASFVILPH